MDLKEVKTHVLKSTKLILSRQKIHRDSEGIYWADENPNFQVAKTCQILEMFVELGLNAGNSSFIRKIRRYLFYKIDKSDNFAVMCRVLLKSLNYGKEIDPKIHEIIENKIITAQNKIDGSVSDLIKGGKTFNTSLFLDIILDYIEVLEKCSSKEKYNFCELKKNAELSFVFLVKKIKDKIENFDKEKGNHFFGRNIAYAYLVLKKYIKKSEHISNSNNYIENTEFKILEIIKSFALQLEWYEILRVIDISYILIDIFETNADIILNNNDNIEFVESIYNDYIIKELEKRSNLFEVALLLRSILYFQDIDCIKGCLIDELLNKYIDENSSKIKIQENQQKKLINNCVLSSLKVDQENMEFEVLKGGESGDLVIRIKNIDLLGYLPRAGGTDKIYSFEKCITKISSQRNFYKEIEKYNSIPPNIKLYFANLDQYKTTFFMNEDVYSGMFQEDLRNFNSFHEYLSSLKKKLERGSISSQESINNIKIVIKNIIEVYIEILKVYYNIREKEKEKYRTKNIIIPDSFYIKKFDIAIKNIFRIIFKIKKFASLKVFLSSSLKMKINQDSYEYEPITNYIKPYTARKRNHISLKNLTWMHGDFHTRNIMIKEIINKKEKYDIKLIDLDNMNKSGDYLYDMGMLIADIFGYSDTIAHNKAFQINPGKIEYEYPLGDKIYCYRNEVENYIVDILKEKEIIKKIEKCTNNLEKKLLCRIKIAEALFLLTSLSGKHDISEVIFLYCEALRRLEEASAIVYEKR